VDLRTGLDTEARGKDFATAEDRKRGSTELRRLPLLVNGNANYDGFIAWSYFCVWNSMWAWRRLQSSSCHSQLENLIKIRSCLSC
jgi:hypothetical protein